MENTNYLKTKRVCFFTCLAMSSVFSLPPLLFATFREMYHISYTLLGTLVLINFCTQLGIDLVFSFFSKYFNIHRTIRLMPLITASGICIYALIPMLFPQYAFIGLVTGTVLFSVAAGLAEVLISPTVAALPSDTPEKDMSILHSLYGYGVVGVVLISTIFLKFIGKQYWMFLALSLAVLPVIAAILLMTSHLPQMKTDEAETTSKKSRYRTKALLLCVACIFLGACAEQTMTSWISVYVENVLHIPKMWGDILGMSVFALLLALTRTYYAKYGKNISSFLLASFLGATICYLIVAFSFNAALSLVACVAVGIFTSMLWPGTLILMEEKVPGVNVAAYALMAAGGDFGASFAPQALGILVDKVSITGWAVNLGQNLSVTPEDIGFKTGMLAAAILPALGALLMVYMKKTLKASE